ncbi:oxidoreductase [Streptomyces sulfonofaciens]|uniref:Oxidoreductase n=1 Tax=Streptomyces sulfonofaciens TaxID=68272 RepID=A0A919L829_9ACTN|nr:aldo/keto reductase [Streptomyces sulfonofaciens]GHH86859.1 oxidoreductase [Streptomyces sulfonofaciens]
MNETSGGSRITIAEDFTVGRVGYGAMKLTGPQVWGEYPDREEAVALLRKGVEEGIDFIDTADVYGPHTNEILIRDALHPYPRGLRIATKGGFVRGGFDYGTLDAVGNANYLRQSAHMSARRLGVETIDLYYLHSGRATDVPFEEQIGTLVELQQQGLIRHIGLSNITLEQLRTAQGIADIVAVTALYNVTVRIGADLLSVAEQEGIAFSPWHPVTLTDGPAPGPDRAREVIAPIAAGHGATPQQIALAWQLHRSPVSLPIPGTTSLAHLRDNLAAQSIKLSDEEVTAITAITTEP